MGKTIRRVDLLRILRRIRGASPADKNIKINIAGRGYCIRVKPWSKVCFSSKEIATAPKKAGAAWSYFVNVAKEKSEKKVKREKWDGCEYFYSDECGEQYGLTMFYRRA